MYKRLYVKYPLFLSNSLDIFLKKNLQISNFTRNLPVGPQQFHADGRTGTMKTTKAFRSFANAPIERAFYSPKYTVHITGLH